LLLERRMSPVDARPERPCGLLEIACNFGIAV
jgi:hypothetical protein